MTAALLDAVAAQLPTLRERAAEAERCGRLDDSSLSALRELGVFRQLQPARFGGAEADPVVFYDVIRSVAGADGSLGWVTALLGVHAWQLALFPDAAQSDVWGGDPQALLCSAYAPTGTPTPVEGGYRLSGRWSFASGCDHCSWALLGALVLGDQGVPVDYVTLLLPRADYRVDDTWDAVGLRATGSHDLVVDDAFVPMHRTLSFADVAALRCPGQQSNPAPLYRLPFGTLFSYTVTAAIIGMAQGAYDGYVDGMRRRVQVSLGGQKAGSDPITQARVARAGSDIDAAWLQLVRNLGEQMAHTGLGEDPPLELRLRARRDQVRGTERAVGALDLLFATAGGRSLRSGNPLERAWRDAHAGSVHAANDAERWLGMYGRGAFGHEIQDAMI